MFESEHKRAYSSRINRIHLILAPFLIFCSGLCACAMFIFEDNFARAVLIMMMCGYLFDWL
jgi:hypothetical protein